MNRDVCNLIPLPIRLIYGAALMRAGFPKLFTAKGHANIIHELEGMHVPAPRIMAWVVGIMEFFGGLFLFVGFRTRLTAVIESINVLSNLALIYINGGQPKPLPGEQGLPDELSSYLGLGGLLALVISGGGAYSIDGPDAESEDA
jgi:putative oxidoreductase